METAEAARRQEAWARKNARSASAADQKRLESRTALGTAMDAMVQKLARTAGAPPGGTDSEPAGAATAKPSGRSSPHRATRQPTIADDTDISAVRGIGPKRAAALRAAGVKTAAVLADITSADAAASVARRSGMPLKTLLACIENARVDQSADD